MSSRVWFHLHSWIGLKLSLFMSFILITGTLAVFAHELDWLATPEMRVTPQDAPLAWGAMAENAAARFPDGTIELLYAPIDPWFAAEAVVLMPSGERRRVHLDPYDGSVKGVGSWANMHRFLRQTHRHLMLPTWIGVPLVSCLAFLLMASLASGLVVYKKWWRGFFRLPRRRNARTFWGDLHRLAALWSLWFVALIAVTGVWYLVESLGGHAPPAQTAPSPGAGPVLPTAVMLDAGKPVDDLVARAAAAYPALRIRELRPPRRTGDPFVFLGQAEAWLVRDRVNAVALDPATGALRWIADGRTLTVHQRIAEMADPLHFGTLGGLPTKIVWFLFGLVLSGLSLSGIYLFGLRALHAVDGSAGLAARAAWRGMGWWRYPALALIVLSLALTPAALAL